MSDAGQQLGREEAIALLGEAAAWWGQEVPDDPGVGELAELLDAAAARLLDEAQDARRRHSGTVLAEGAEAARAAARLGGLLPAVSLWQLRTAVARAHAARSRLGETVGL